MCDDLAALLRANDLHVVSLDRAVTDPAYRLPDDQVDPDGDEWLTRWSQALHKVLPWNSFPEPPADIVAANDGSTPRRDRAGGRPPQVFDTRGDPNRLLSSFRPLTRRTPMKTPFLLAGALAVGLLSSGLASAQTCRDAQGHYMKCPAATSTTTTAKTASKTTTANPPKAAPAPSAAKSERCRDASGHYVKCGAAGATPATPAAATPAPAQKPTTTTQTTTTKTTGTKATGTKATGTKTTSSVASGGDTNPAGASAKCKDGTYSHSQTRSGTCSRHGGVAQWMK
jgi:uncharacterized protein DUF3761